MEVEVITTPEGGTQIKVARVGPEGYAQSDFIDPDALASYAELLGYTDAVDVLEALLRIIDNGSPEPDPVTGENAWTELYAILRHREEARETEAIKAKAEGKRDDPRSPSLRGALAARRAVMEPLNAISEGESLLSQSRAKTRAGFGCANPRKQSISARGQGMKATQAGDCEEAPGCSARMCEEDRGKAVAAIEGLLPELTERRARFLHKLTSNAEDPLAEVAEDATPVAPSGMDSVLARYAKADGDA